MASYITEGRFHACFMPVAPQPPVYAQPRVVAWFSVTFFWDIWENVFTKMTLTNTFVTIFIYVIYTSVLNHKTLSCIFPTIWFHKLLLKKIAVLNYLESCNQTHINDYNRRLHDGKLQKFELIANVRSLCF